MVDYADTKRAYMMKKADVSKEPCSECGGQVKKKYISQAFERGGITVKLSGIGALVCSKCGEIYFQPGGSEKVVEAANSLFKLAAAERQYKRPLTGQICRA
jgi:YgiT-type zinc finger domain-containing protein